MLSDLAKYSPKLSIARSLCDAELLVLRHSVYTSYWSDVVAIPLSRTIFELFDIE